LPAAWLDYVAQFLTGLSYATGIKLHSPLKLPHVCGCGREFSVNAEGADASYDNELLHCFICPGKDGSLFDLLRKHFADIHDTDDEYLNVDQRDLLWSLAWPLDSHLLEPARPGLVSAVFSDVQCAARVGQFLLELNNVRREAEKNAKAAAQQHEDAMTPPRQEASQRVDGARGEDGALPSSPQLGVRPQRDDANQALSPQSEGSPVAEQPPPGQCIAAAPLAGRRDRGETLSPQGMSPGSGASANVSPQTTRGIVDDAAERQASRAAWSPRERGIAYDRARRAAAAERRASAAQRRASRAAAASSPGNDARRPLEFE
jgi:hypothetical protein